MDPEPLFALLGDRAAAVVSRPIGRLFQRPIVFVVDAAFDRGLTPLARLAVRSLPRRCGRRRRVVARAARLGGLLQAAPRA